MKTVTALILLGWALEAFAIGWTMRRRGFDGYVWTVLGAVLGPLTIPLAGASLIRPPVRVNRVIRRGRDRTVGVDILVGVDGSAESHAAVDRLLDLVGRPVGHVTLARVVPIDAGPPDVREAEAGLAAEADAHPALSASAVLLHGSPAPALIEHARKSGCGLIVVGSRGAGRTKSVLGSVTVELTRGAGIPVLVVDDSPTTTVVDADRQVSAAEAV